MVLKARLIYSSYLRCCTPFKITEVNLKICYFPSFSNKDSLKEEEQVFCVGVSVSKGSQLVDFHGTRLRDKAAESLEI